MRQRDNRRFKGGNQNILPECILNFSGCCKIGDITCCMFCYLQLLKGVLPEPREFLCLPGLLFHMSSYPIVSLHLRFLLLFYAVLTIPALLWNISHLFLNHHAGIIVVHQQCFIFFNDVGFQPF